MLLRGSLHDKIVYLSAQCDKNIYLSAQCDKVVYLSGVNESFAVRLMSKLFGATRLSASALVCVIKAIESFGGLIISDDGASCAVATKALAANNGVIQIDACGNIQPYKIVRGITNIAIQTDVIASVFRNITSSNIIAFAGDQSATALRKTASIEDGITLRISNQTSAKKELSAQGAMRLYGYTVVARHRPIVGKTALGLSASAIARLIRPRKIVDLRNTTIGDMTGWTLDQFYYMEV